MTAVIKLGNWDHCPESWRNFADYIHSLDRYGYEDEFWVRVHDTLARDHHARIIGDITDPTVYLEFESERHLTLFNLRYSCPNTIS